MVSEPHVPGAEFGELQLAMWTRQFEALRDGDRFFYGNDPALDAIAEVYGIDFRRSLSEVIAANTDADPDELPANVFLLDDGDQVVDVPQVVAEQTNEIAAEQKEQPDEGGERRADRPRDGRRERDRDRPRRPRPPRPGT
jgi:hypothetical protein